jgi:signal transduction histidine kinase
MVDDEPRFTIIFAKELYEQLRWFARLRWLAVLGLASASLMGPRLGFPDVWPSLLIVAIAVALYNLGFTWSLRRRKESDRSYANLRTDAVLQMVMDLAALIAAIHFTGCLSSPLLLFFAFHMAIGTMMISARTVYLLAGLTALTALGLYVLEGWEIVPTNSLHSGTEQLDVIPPVNLIALAASMFVIVYLTDSVTGRFKQRSIDLFRATRGMEDLERRKSHYMRISAHQLRSPLATVRTSLEVLSEGIVDPTSDRGQRLARGALDRVDGLLRTVNDLLSLAKIREGRERSQWNRKVNVSELLTGVVESSWDLAEDRRLELVHESQGVIILDYGIPADLTNAFENLVANAIKYSPNGGTVTVRLETTGREAVVRVTDQGIGIPEDSVGQVFLEFVRMPNAKQLAPEGTGMGLAIVREAVEAHGGAVCVDSVEGKGSTFTVTLPIQHIPPEVQRPPARLPRVGV